jgi:pimeloyl-ACP methyl ester carboxylesterase
MHESSPTETSTPLILLHGLGSGGWSMYVLAARLGRMGFDVEVVAYRSHGQSLSQMTDEIQSALPERFNGKFNVVAHSLGGLVGHQLAERLGSKAISKVVMLGSPFLGTRAAGFLANSWMARFIYGPIWSDLLPEVRREHDIRIEGVELGMIAGVIPGTRFLPRGASDGLIPLASTKGGCFNHHIAIPASHATLLISKVAADNVGSFLTFGYFLQASQGSQSDGFTPEQSPVASQPQPSF